ncbi:hypothetical protein [Hymenobacter jeollabukensis]
MQELINLAKIVTNRRLTTLPLLEFGAKGDNATRETEFLQMLVTETNLTKSQLARRLYGENSETTQAALRKLKQRLQDKLMSHLFFLDNTDSRHPVHRRYEQQCLDLHHQATVLWREGGQGLVPQVLRKLVRLAEEGEFTSMALSGWQMMRSYSVEINDTTLFRQCQTELERLVSLRAAEEEAEDLFWSTKSALGGVITVRTEVLNTKLPQVVARLTELWDQTRSYTVYNALLKMRLFSAEMAGDFEKVAGITGEAEALFAQGQLNPKRFDSRFTKFYHTYALLRTGRLREGLAVCEPYLAAFHISSTNWFSYLENYLLLAMHAGEYDKAADVLRRQQQNPNVGKLVVSAAQRWDLYRAYLFLVRPKEAGLRPLHFAQLVQRVPDHAKNKQGYNVAILILQFFHFLRENNEEALQGRLESLRKYEGMHLRTENATRSRLMFRLLQLVVKLNFDPQACAKKGAGLIEKLRASPAPGEAYAEVEIIPYEALWTLTLQVLEQRRQEVR